MDIFVHDTAFIIAHYRALHEDLSKDPYATLWLRPSLEKWSQDFAEKVSPYDKVLHCIRNRYFYEELRAISKQEQPILFVNLGAGFSMYPYVLPESTVTLEVDFPEIVQYKQQHVEQFIKEDTLPYREVTHIPADITKPEGQQKIAEFVSNYPNHKMVILIEGVFFFLPVSRIAKTLSFCEQIQKNGDLLLCVSFDEKIRETKVFKRLVHYFSEVLKSENNPYTLMPHSFYENISGYETIKQGSTLALGKLLHAIEPSLPEHEVLNEYCYSLQRQ